MKKLVFHALSCFAVSLLMVTNLVPLIAQEKDAEQEITAAPIDQLSAHATLANELIQFGRDKKTPEALVTAALILSQLPVVDTNESGESNGKESASHAKEIQDLLEEALAIRPEDSVLKELVARTRDKSSEKSRGFGQFGSLKKMMIKIKAKQKTVVAKVKKNKGEPISATIPQPGVVAISTVTSSGGLDKVISSGNSSASVVAPKTGEYAVVIQAGQIAIDTSLSLR